MIYKYGTYIWTASAAGWCFLGFYLDHLPAFVVGVCCLIMAAAWNELV